MKDITGKEIKDGNIVSVWESASWDDEIPIEIQGKIEFMDGEPFFSALEGYSDEHNGLYDFKNGRIIKE